MRRLLELSSTLVLLLACGPAGLATRGPAGTLVTVGGGARVVETFTDLDTVRDVAASAERVFVATDLGLLVHASAGEERPVRVRASDGLPSDDTLAVAVDRTGGVVVATAGGLAHVDAEAAVAPFGDPPPVGRVTSLAFTDDGTLWAGGAEGLARFREGAWARFGEPAAVTLLAPAADALWVGTTRGAWRIEGDVVREHALGRGIPEGYVRSLVPLDDGEALALVEGPSDSKIGYWDGTRWWSYTLDGLDAPALGLVRFQDRTLLVTPADAIQIVKGPLEGSVQLVGLERGEPRGVRSYGARILAAADLPMVYATRPAEPPAEVARRPSPLAPVPADRPAVPSPELRARAVTLPVRPDAAYLVRARGDDLFLADQNRGVARITPGGFSTVLRSLDLVDATDEQIAIDASHNTWVRAADGTIGLYRDGRIQRVPSPDGVKLQALANGPDGAYVLGLVEGQAATVRIYRVSTDGYTQQMERQLAVEPPLVSIPFFGITDDRVVWAGLRVTHELGEGTRMRGVAVFGEEGPVVYHRRGATPETDGPEALSMPDEVDNIDLGMAGYAWMPSLTGAIRVGNHQAVVFGEARGVRGEVVSDVAVGEGGRVWVAAAEGVGFWESATGFDFQLPALVQHARPTALAIDSRGNLWAAGQRGVVYYDGHTWQTLDESNGLPTNQLVDVEVDGQDRVWLLATDRVMVFTRARAPAVAD